jgi:hypothetical protein
MRSFLFLVLLITAIDLIACSAIRADDEPEEGDALIFRAGEDVIIHKCADGVNLPAVERHVDSSDGHRIIIYLVNCATI